MALSTDQKKVVFQAAAVIIPALSSAEFLRATIAQSTAWAAATDPLVIAPVIIAEINAFRVANPDNPNIPYLAAPGSVNSFQTVSIAQTLAKLG